MDTRDILPSREHHTVFEKDMDANGRTKRMSLCDAPQKAGYVYLL